jgi:hypothetical protein
MDLVLKRVQRHLLTLSHPLDEGAPLWQWTRRLDAFESAPFKTALLNRGEANSVVSISSITTVLEVWLP